MSLEFIIHNDYIICLDMSLNIGPFETDEASMNVMGDICDFLNDKYIDKNINEEWGKIDINKRIKYHEEQIEILKKENPHWKEHGNGVK